MSMVGFCRELLFRIWTTGTRAGRVFVCGTDRNGLPAVGSAFPFDSSLVAGSPIVLQNDGETVLVEVPYYQPPAAFNHHEATS